MKRKYRVPSILLAMILCALTAYTGEKRFQYTFHPEDAPHSFLMGNRVLISSKGLTLSLEQLDRLPFAAQFPVFQTEPDIYFVYFRFTIRNRTGAKVEINPIFFFALNDRREFRKPLNYDEIFRLLSKFHDPSEFNELFQKCLADFFSPIPNGEDREGYLIFRSFREKAKTGMIKLDNITIAGEPVSFSVPYRLERKVVTIE